MNVNTFPIFAQFIIPPHSSLYTTAWRVSKVIIDGRWLFRHSVCAVSGVTCRSAPLLLTFSMVVMALLLLRGGDVESNPGPGESNSDQFLRMKHNIFGPVGG